MPFARPSARPDGTPSDGRRWWGTAVALALALTGCTAPQDGDAPAESTPERAAAVEPATDASGQELEAPSSDASSTAPSTGAGDATASPEADPSSSAGSEKGPDEDAGAGVDPSLPLAAQSAEDVPMRAFGADERPPQFVLFSFDNGLHNERWESFLETSDEVGAHFTVFQAGVTLLADQNRNAYAGPGGNAPGYVGTQLGGTEEELAQRVRHINEAHSRGHEIGSHAVGHLCSGTPYGGDQWTSAEWMEEFGTFDSYLSDVRGANGFGADFPQLTVPADDVKGIRLPCLDGQWEELVPAWEEFGIEYDTSQHTQVGIGWPYQKDGIWEFEMPIAYAPMLGEQGAAETMIMAMDYNFWMVGNRNHPVPDDTAWLSQLQLDTYRYMFESAYQGNRAPLVFGNHFSDWAGNAFNTAQDQAMRELCVREDAYCVTYQQMVEWLELQDPEVLEAWASQPRSGLGDGVEAVSWRPTGG